MEVVEWKKDVCLALLIEVVLSCIICIYNCVVITTINCNRKWKFIFRHEQEVECVEKRQLLHYFILPHLKTHKINPRELQVDVTGMNQSSPPIGILLIPVGIRLPKCHPIGSEVSGWRFSLRFSSSTMSSGGTGCQNLRSEILSAWVGSFKKFGGSKLVVNSFLIWIRSLLILWGSSTFCRACCAQAVLPASCLFLWEGYHKNTLVRGENER